MVWAACAALASNQAEAGEGLPWLVQSFESSFTRKNMRQPTTIERQAWQELSRKAVVMN
jgi:hypothetical protein